MADPVFRRPTHSLHNKVAIVSGAGAAGNGIGNGRASAILLAEDGCSVVCVDLKLALAQRTAEMITEEGHGRAIAIEADVSKEAECKRIVETTLSTYGRLDILINVVGIGGPPGTSVDVDMAAFAKAMEINVYSMVQTVKYAVPAMLKNDPSDGWRGSIVNFASIAGLRGGPGTILYPTSKGAVVQMTRAMAANHGPDLIRANCVCPGSVYTPMMYADGMSAEQRETRKNRGLLKVEGNAWDIGAAVRFLAGDQARWITGVDLVVDAGAISALATDVPVQKAEEAK